MKRMASLPRLRCALLGLLPLLPEDRTAGEKRLTWWRRTEVNQSVKPAVGVKLETKK